MTSPFAGTGLLVRIALGTGWRTAAAWVVGLASLYLITGLSIGALYDTPQELATYGASIGESTVMLTGRVAGLDTLGGILMNEYSFLVAFGIPVMAIALTARATRKEEESGRSELLLAGRVGRLAPTAAALVVVAGVFAVLGVALWTVTLTLDIDRGGAVLYAVSIAATGWVYASGTAVLAQVLSHNRTVWASAMAASGLTLITRGVGDTNRNWLSWTSPLGWQGMVRPFGDPSVGPLIVAVGVAAGLAALALWLASHRDVGQGMIPTRTGPASASAWRASRAGTAVHQHLGAFTGWTLGGVALMVVYGGLMNVVVEAIMSNPGLAAFLADSGTVVDSIVQTLITLVGFLGAGFALQTLSGLRGEETSGRLEMALSVSRSRWSWLAAHTAVVSAGTVIVVLAGSAAFGICAATALGDPGLAGRILAAGAWQAAAAGLFVGISVALFGALPRLQVLAWAPFAVAVVVTFMGPTLRLTDDQMRLSPFGAVGSAPVGPVDPVGVTALITLTSILIVVGLVGFRRRDVPRT
ncbi:ABC transporter permease [Dietzia sp. ANT_WB102]|uniref:ABC transporter permease n=1 Tax=Dietzia sp. ANT_WB102 TaxID=2597345 RepID=UPI0011ED9588|nr:hypothetical protein [Dietzia sp. ANT_WB102]KAA0917190.1 hypothetical protein FQ137_13370 [Dietzia sp. ANT_WB102]